METDCISYGNSTTDPRSIDHQSDDNNIQYSVQVVGSLPDKKMFLADKYAVIVMSTSIGASL